LRPGDEGVVKRREVKHLLVRSILALAAGGLIGCTTYIEPVECGSHEHECGGREEDVVFCESRALTVAGADCRSAGVAASRTFCVVSFGRCVSTSYALGGGDCRILDHELVRQAAFCPPGTPTFGPY
jgi:hypothetical protein